jgi:endo-1,4-beta-D-glucanase Y
VIAVFRRSGAGRGRAGLQRAALGTTLSAHAAAFCVLLCTLALLATLVVGTVTASVASAVYAGPDQQAVAWFLTSYVRPNGRVYRPDQNGDTVSEGQAYGLLLAEVSGQYRLFGQIWQWTRDHLQRRDGLFAFHADAAGRVLSPNSASDADLLIAWALLRYGGPDATRIHDDGSRVADAVLRYEVTNFGPRAIPILTAGQWATGRPATLNPSYWSLPALTSLASLTGNHQWQRLAADAVAVTARLTRNGALLPPDWATLTADGQVRPRSAPDGSQSRPQYGLDAQRTDVWFASSSCVPQAQTLAARWWGMLHSPARAEALALHLDGAIRTSEPSVLPVVASAATAHAAGDAAASSHLLSVAVFLQRRQPRYYGGAWAALGLTLLDSNLLSGC